MYLSLNKLVLVIVAVLLYTALAVGFVGNFASAQVTETASHSFTQDPPPPPTNSELDRVSELSEKYIMGTISPEEINELKKLKFDFTDIDTYKAQYEQQGAIPVVEQSDEVIGEESEVLVPAAVQEVVPAPGQAATAAPDNTILYIVIFAVFINFILLVYILFRLKK